MNYVKPVSKMKLSSLSLQEKKEIVRSIDKSVKDFQDTRLTSKQREEALKFIEDRIGVSSIFEAMHIRLLIAESMK